MSRPANSFPPKTRAAQSHAHPDERRLHVDTLLDLAFDLAALMSERIRRPAGSLPPEDEPAIADNRAESAPGDSGRTPP
ncbi:MAG: hypothetical protein LBG43_10705 [Treponema sp.]|nr:hypothetical protein [Treponema sp.]